MTCGHAFAAVLGIEESRGASAGEPRPRHDQKAGISGGTVRVHERSGDSHAGLAAHAGQRGTFHADRPVYRRGGRVELGRGGRVCRAAVRQGRMPRRGDRRAGTRRLRDRLPAARTILFSGSHPRRGLPDVVHADAGQAAPRRTGLRHAAGAGLSSFAAGRRRRRVARGRRASRSDCAVRRGTRRARRAASRCARPSPTIARSRSPNATPSRSASTRTASCGNSICPTWPARRPRPRCCCSTP